MLNKFVPYRTDNDVRKLVSYYDEQAFQDIPAMLRQAVISRYITFPTRQPTEQEKLETVGDARMHRILNNEKTIEDYKDKYLHGKTFNFLA
jgi:hypothetical protein